MLIGKKNLLYFFGGIAVFCSIAASTFIYVDPPSATNIVKGLLNPTQFGYVYGSSSINTGALVTNLVAYNGLSVGATNNTSFLSNTVLAIVSTNGKFGETIVADPTTGYSTLGFFDHSANFNGGIVGSANGLTLVGPDGLLSDGLTFSTNKIAYFGSLFDVNVYKDMSVGTNQVGTNATFRIASSNGKYAMLINSGADGYARIMFSSRHSDTNVYGGIVAGNGFFVLLGPNGTNDNRIMITATNTIIYGSFTNIP